MYSQKWNCAASSQFLNSCICERVIYSQDRSSPGNICFKFLVQCLCSVFFPFSFLLLLSLLLAGALPGTLLLYFLFAHFCVGRAASLLSYTPGFLGWTYSIGWGAGPSALITKFLSLLKFVVVFSSFTDSQIYVYSSSFCTHPPPFSFLPLYHFPYLFALQNSLLLFISFLPPSYPFPIISLLSSSFRPPLLFFPHFVVSLFFPSYLFLPHPVFPALILSLISSLFSPSYHIPSLPSPYIPSIILFLFLFTFCLLLSLLSFLRLFPYFRNNSSLSCLPCFSPLPISLSSVLSFRHPNLLKLLPPPLFILFSLLDSRFFGFL